MTINLSKHDKLLIKLAEKGGGDGHLVLLDEIQALEEKVASFEETLKMAMGKEIRFSPEFPDVQTVKIEGVELLKGDKGDAYILTNQDKKDIAERIKVPVVEKIIEKTEMIREQPIITNEIKEVAVTETPEQIRDKLGALQENERLDISAVKGVQEEIEKTRRIIQNIPRGGGGGQQKVQVSVFRGTAQLRSLRFLTNRQ